MHNPAPVPRICPACQRPLPAGAAEGVCPGCAAARNLLSGSLFTQAGGGGGAPSIEEVAPHFPQLEIESLLGRGGMGIVYKARQKSLNRPVALKLLAPEREGDPAFAERFAAEAQVLARLSHPHIVTIHDFGRSGGFYYLLMEFVEGVSLRQLIATRRLEPREALAVVPQICDALQYAHDHGVVHRDIKPENLLLDRLGRVKVADFGLARLLEADAASEPGVIRAAGTPGYMAPEQRERPEVADPRSDIYALGAVLFEMLTGERPGAQFAAPSQKVRVDVRLDSVVLRALETKPELRWQKASELKTEVETLLGDPVGGRAEVPTGRSTRRWPLIVVGLAALIGVVLAVREILPDAPPVRSESREVMLDLSAAFAPRTYVGKDISRALDTAFGFQQADGIPFNIGGQVILGGGMFRSRNPKEVYPERTPEVSVGRAFDELHLLHVTYWEDPHGERVATVRFNYADGTQAELPMLYGVHLRDWSRRPSEETERLDDPESCVLLRTTRKNEYASTERIFRTRLLNPRPGSLVRSIVFESAGGLAAYGLLAATIADSDPRRTVTPPAPLPDPEAAFDGQMTVHVVDAATGAPVAGQLLLPGGDFGGNYVVSQPVRTGADGSAVWRFPISGRYGASQVHVFRVDEEPHRAALSWEAGSFPREAFFLEGVTGRQLSDPPGPLPAWRFARVRTLLKEWGATALDIQRIGGHAPGDWTGINQRRRAVLADLGELVRGTEGEAFWVSAATRIRIVDTTGIGAMGNGLAPFEAANQVGRTNLARWLWSQIEPNSEPLAFGAEPRSEAQAAVRPADLAAIAPHVDSYRGLLKAWYERRGSDGERSAAAALLTTEVQAVLKLLEGTDVDAELEGFGNVVIDGVPKGTYSARSVLRLRAHAQALAERGLVDDVDATLQVAATCESMLMEYLAQRLATEGAPHRPRQ